MIQLLRKKNKWGGDEDDVMHDLYLYIMRYVTIKILLLIFFPITLHCQLPSDFTDQKVSTGWELPMGLTFDNQHRMLVWEKAGHVHIVDTNGIKLPNPLIDISEEVGNFHDLGLLGFALDPDYANNGYFYLLYAVDRHHLLHYGTPAYHPDTSETFAATIGRVTRYTADKNTDFTSIVSGSRKVLLGEEKHNGIPILYSSHGIGSLAFGEDGSLLISSGDGTSNKGVDLGGDSLGTYASQGLASGIIGPDEDVGSYRSQYQGSLAGKVLRIDPETGDGLPGNPFYDPAAPRSAPSRMWALGFRNPFRMIVWPGTGSHDIQAGKPGTLIVGDVGASLWEEINLVTEGGQNFSWPLIEGMTPFWGFWANPSPENPLAPNPLYGVNGCTVEYFSFRNLFDFLRANDSTDLFNPCDKSVRIPEYIPTFIETPPALAYSHALWNLPERAIVMHGFRADGRIQTTDIEDSTASVQGENFAGVSSIAGTFYSGDSFPPEYRDAYFHVDFGGWIRALYFDDNFQLREVRRFSSNNYGVIHLESHPTDGCLYYVKLDQHEHVIRKICYGGVLPPHAHN